MAPTVCASIRGTSPTCDSGVIADTTQQVLVGHAKRIAQEYPQRYRYQYVKAAETLRAPYWDWAAETGVPQATVPETVTINMPDGEVLKQKNIANPLYTFKFPKKALNGAFGPFDSQRRTRTYRCPAPNSYPTTANANLDGRPYKKWIVSSLQLVNSTCLTLGTVRCFHYCSRLLRVCLHRRWRNQLGTDSQRYSLGRRMRWSVLGR